MNSLIQEKRKYERFDTNVKVLYRNAGTINAALLRNINMNGMQLVTAEDIPLNDIVTVALSVPGLVAVNNPKIMAKILWTIKLENNDWLLGASMIANYAQITRFMTDVFAINSRIGN